MIGGGVFISDIKEEDDDEIEFAGQSPEKSLKK